MGVMLRTLIRQVQHNDFRLVAGKKGLDNEVRWTHMVESRAITEFLNGQELVFVTGIGLGPDLSLLELVEDVHAHKASGIVLNVGPYIESISPEILAFGDAHDFPIFEVPWEVHMADIMRIFCFSITKSEQSELELSAALSNAFQCPEQEKLYVPTLMMKGLMNSWRYSCAVIRLVIPGRAASDVDYSRCASRLSNHLQFYYSHALCCTQEGHLVVLFYNCSEEERATCARETCEFLHQGLRPGEAVRYAVGGEVSGLTNLHRSHRQALRLCALMEGDDIPGQRILAGDQGADSRQVLYEETGVYQLLLSMTDRQAMESYVQHTVLPLIQYDSADQNDLTQTVRSYLRHNCSIKDAAEELMVHRNTVTYKVHKAEEILGISLAPLNNRLQIQLGLLAYSILQTDQ